MKALTLPIWRSMIRTKTQGILVPAFLALFVIIFAVGNYGLGFEKWEVHWWADIAWTIASLLVGLKCLHSAMLQQGHFRKAWIWFGLGCLSWFSGMVVWDYLELFRHEVTPFPALSDIGYMAFAPFFIIGMFYYKSQKPTIPVTLNQVCDLVIILSAILIVAPIIVVGPIQGFHPSLIYASTAVAYPVLYMATFFFGLICLWFYVCGPSRKPFLLILLGIATHAFTDTLYAYALLGHTYEAGHYLDVYWIIGFAFIYWGAAVQDEVRKARGLSEPHESPLDDTRELEHFISATVLVAVVVVIYLFKESIHEELMPYLVTIGILGIGFIGLKEWWNYLSIVNLYREVRSSEVLLRRSTDKLQQSENRLAGILTITPEAIISIDEFQQIIIFSKGAEQIFGYTADEVMGQPLDMLLPERVRALHRSHVGAFASSPGPSRRMGERPEISGLRKNGEEFPAEASISKLDLSGEQVFTVVLRDITHRKQAEQALRTKTEQLSAVTDAMTEFLEKGDWREASTILLRAALVQTESEYGFIGVIVEGPVLRILAHEGIVWDKNINREFYENAVRTYHQVGYLEFTNFENLFGRVITTGKVVISNDPGSDPRSGGLPPGHPPLQSFLGVPVLRGVDVVGMIGVANRPGSYAGAEQARIETLSRAVGVLYDSYRRQQREAALEEERRRAQEALAEQAIRDSLTNLYNRRYFNYRMREEITRADRHQEPLAILLCDLDHFKTINDTQGHQVGDEVLKSVAKSIQESTRGTDLVFRWGGDEIVVVSNTTRDGILIIAERIMKGIQAVSQQAEMALDLSIGVALYPEHGRTVDELIRLADRALYIAKKGGDKVHIGEEEYRLDEDTIKVVFQPIVDVRTKTVTFRGYEALSRDAQGKLSILELFKRYQAVGQLSELKCLCFKLQLRAAERAGLKRVFINVDFGILGQLESWLKPPDMEVILEISELEALHEIENRLKIAQQWREKGFQFAIDDFGAGFVSLPFIARLIPEYIKLDRSTVLQAVSSEKFGKFLKDLLQAIQNYSTEGIIAEGIETEKELQVVKRMGIHLVQGFLLGKPQELV